MSCPVHATRAKYPAKATQTSSNIVSTLNTAAAALGGVLAKVHL